MKPWWTPLDSTAARAAHAAYAAGGSRALDQLVVHASRVIQPLAALTPLEAGRERERLVQEIRAGRPARPRWTYTARDDAAVRRALDAAVHALEQGATEPVLALYLARLKELALEAELCAAAGSPRVAELAAHRFATEDARTAAEASQLAARWLGQDRSDDASATRIASDSWHPRSLLSRMREAVGRNRLPFSVVAQSGLAPLAATGERVILVCTQRLLSDEDTARTVVHEIEGHARPRARAAAATCALFRAGTARGADHQEGRALLIEERAGLLGPRRMRQLAARHCAVESMLGGACFDDVVHALRDVHALETEEAVVVSERAFRGGSGLHAGLGRERVYLESFLRLRDHLRERPEDEDVLAAGQIALGAVAVLRPFAPPAAESVTGALGPRGRRAPS